VPVARLAGHRWTIDLSVLLHVVAASLATVALSDGRQCMLVEAYVVHKAYAVVADEVCQRLRQWVQRGLSPFVVSCPR